VDLQQHAGKASGIEGSGVGEANRLGAIELAVKAAPCAIHASALTEVRFEALIS
jgi:hypothetical protein